MLNLYQEILMDHYKNPRNKGVLVAATFISEQRNSSCGDEVICSGIVHADIIVTVQFDGKGCVISQATASLLSERVHGMHIKDIIKLDKDYLVAMIGMVLGLVRMQCALLSLIALTKGISKVDIQRE